jgi:hypothetical protein
MFGRRHLEGCLGQTGDYTRLDPIAALEVRTPDPRVRPVLRYCGKLPGLGVRYSVASSTSTSWQCEPDRACVPFTLIRRPTTLPPLALHARHSRLLPPCSR